MFQPLPTASMSVGQLFADSRRFIIPFYQRPYSWTVEEASQLLEDVANAAGIDDGQVLESDYFLGAILLLNIPAPPVGENVPASHDFEIVDGQQRLVTLVILACALRDLEASPGTELARRLDALARPQADPGASRIVLLGDDWNFVNDYIVAPGGCLRPVAHTGTLDSAQRAIIDARNCLIRNLSEFTAAQRAALCNYICDSCHFVVVTTTDIDRAHRIFMVLNDRGRPLQKKDILKAEILRSVEPEYRDQAFALWRDVEARLGDQMEAFLSHLRSAAGYHRLQVIAGVRRIVRESGSARGFLLDVFRPLADAYAMILSARDAEADIPAELRRVLVGLTRLSGSEWVPAALRVLGRDLRPAQASEYLEEIERAAFLMRLVCLGSGKRQTRFAKITSLLSQPDLPALESLYEPTREEQRSISFNLRDLHARNVQACKGLLLRLNDELQPEALFASPTDYTIEHVLPQRPKASSLWRQWFSDTEERMALTASFGNLVLVSHEHNDGAGNDEYHRKKQVYAKPTSRQLQLAITSEFLSSEEWRPEHIREREAALFALLNKIWRLELEPASIDEAVA